MRFSTMCSAGRYRRLSGSVLASRETGAMLTRDDVRGGRVSAYQDVTDRKLGLID